MSCTIVPATRPTDSSRAASMHEVPADGHPGRRLVHVHEVAPDAEEVGDLGQLPEHVRPDPGPGQHRQRHQPDHVLRRPDLVQDQERGQQQEAELRQPGPARRRERQHRDADAGEGEGPRRHQVQRALRGVAEHRDVVVLEQVPDRAPVRAPVPAERVEPSPARRRADRDRQVDHQPGEPGPPRRPCRTRASAPRAGTAAAARRRTAAGRTWSPRPGRAVPRPGNAAAPPRRPGRPRRAPSRTGPS